MSAARRLKIGLILPNWTSLAPDTPHWLQGELPGDVPHWATHLVRGGGTHSGHVFDGSSMQSRWDARDPSALGGGSRCLPRHPSTSRGTGVG